MMKACLILACFVVSSLSLPTMKRNADNIISKRSNYAVDWATFNRIDIGGDGHLEADEFADYVVENLDSGYSYAELVEMWRDGGIDHIDFNGNGMLEWTEFISQDPSYYLDFGRFG